MRVNRASLGPLKELAEGAFGKVYHAKQYHLPGDSSAIAFKEFTKQVGDQARAAENAVSFRDLLSPADQADLDRCTVWPRAVVEERGTVVGLLMPLIAREFFFEATDQATGKTMRKLRELQWLIATPAQLTANGVQDVEETDRLVLLTQLVYDVARLHKQDWVYGDLSFKNAAFAVSPPRMILLDCDGAADLHDSGRKQAHSLAWEPPECAQHNVQDKATDVYKLGLAILRCLNPGKGAATMRDPNRVAGKLDPTGKDLIERTVDRDPARRPTAKELYAYLRGIVASRIAPPEVISARLATPLRVRGMDARVEWEIANVSEVTIRVGASAPKTVPANGGPQFRVFPARDSGPVTIEAENRYGAVRVDLGELVLYEIPPFDPASFLGTLPRLAVPPLEAFTLDALAPALATVPRIAVPELPRPPSIPTADLVGVLREMLLPTGSTGQPPQGSGAAQSLRFPDFGALIAGPTREIAEQLAGQAREFAESQRESYLNGPVNGGD
jgi:serine/threonine protein kinase